MPEHDRNRAPYKRNAISKGLLLFCGLVLAFLWSGCNPGLSDKTFSFYVSCDKNESPDGTFVISCELKNQSSNSYTMLHGATLFYYYIDGDVPLVASPGVTSTMEGHESIDGTLSVKIREKGEHTVTVVSSFHILDESGEEQEPITDFMYEKEFTVTVTG